MKEKNHDMGLFKHFYDLLIFSPLNPKVRCYFMSFHVISYDFMSFHVILIPNAPIVGYMHLLNLEAQKLDFSAASEIATMALQMAVEQASLEAPCRWP